MPGPEIGIYSDKEKKNVLEKNPALIGRHVASLRRIVSIFFFLLKETAPFYLKLRLVEERKENIPAATYYVPAFRTSPLMPYNPAKKLKYTGPGGKIGTSVWCGTDVRRSFSATMHDHTTPAFLWPIHINTMLATSSVTLTQLASLMKCVFSSIPRQVL